MASLLDFLFQGQPVPPQPTGSDTSTSTPLWLQQMTANLGNAATNLAGQEYQPVPFGQVAPPSDATRRAWSMAGGNVGSFQPDLTQAEDLTRQAAQPITGADISRYMSPYMDQVIGGLTSQSNKNLYENVLPGIQDRFVSSGQSRSPQEGQITSQIVGQSQKALNDSIAGALGQGYQGALNTAISQQGAKQTAGAQFGQLGALNQQLGAGDIGQVAAAGQGQDIVNQGNINAALNNFYAQQQWPYQNLGFASNIIRGLPVNTNTQTVGQAYAPGTGGYSASPLASFIGATSGSKALGFARGGVAEAEPVPAHQRRQFPKRKMTGGAMAAAMGG